MFSGLCMSCPLCLEYSVQLIPTYLQVSAEVLLPPGNCLGCVQPQVWNKCHAHLQMLPWHWILSSTTWINHTTSPCWLALFSLLLGHKLLAGKGQALFTCTQHSEWAKRRPSINIPWMNKHMTYSSLLYIAGVQYIFWLNFPLSPGLRNSSLR